MLMADCSATGKREAAPSWPLPRAVGQCCAGRGVSLPLRSFLPEHGLRLSFLFLSHLFLSLFKQNIMCLLKFSSAWMVLYASLGTVPCLGRSTHN